MVLDVVENRLVVQHVLLHLPVRQRQALTLRYLEDFTVAHTAAALAITPHACDMVLQRARHRAQEQLRLHGFRAVSRAQGG